MTRKFICVLVVYCLILCGCSAKKNTEDLSESANKPSIPTATSEEDMLKMYEEEVESTGYSDFGASAYWSSVLREEEKKKEIDYMVNWFKNASYCEILSFSSDGDVATWPDNKKVREKIQTENDFEKIKELITVNEYDIINNWLEDNEIIFQHRFHMEELSGNYCLIYVESEPKESYYKKIDENYYSHVIFYE